MASLLSTTGRDKTREWSVLLRLAIPIIFTNLTMFSMAAVDTLMIGHRSKEDLAAMGLAVVWLQGTSMFASGVLFGMDPGKDGSSPQS